MYHLPSTVCCVTSCDPRLSLSLHIRRTLSLSFMVSRVGARVGCGQSVDGAYVHFWSSPRMQTARTLSATSAVKDVRIDIFDPDAAATCVAISAAVIIFVVVIVEAPYATSLASHRALRRLKRRSHVMPTAGHLSCPLNLSRLC